MSKDVTTDLYAKDKTAPLTCYHCGRMLWEDPRGHMRLFEYSL